MRNVKEHTYIYWMSMVKKYGPIYKMKFGKNSIIFFSYINSYIFCIIVQNSRQCGNNFRLINELLNFDITN